jgi:hypothetical protein
MLPYLCNNIKELVVSLLRLIAKPNVIEETQTTALVKVAQDEKNLLETKNVHLGFNGDTESFEMRKG